nr:unnamed protein product [Callosobruchus chinensis]
MGLEEKQRLTKHDGIMKQNDHERTALQIERPVYQIEELNRDHLYQRPSDTLRHKCTELCRSYCGTKCIKRTVPLLQWLPEYSWKKSFVGDLISGITVSIMHIPQGMAYALLGNVPPIVGIYMAFFPVLVYFIFGTSRHVSMGTFAVVCLMTGKVVAQHSTVEILQNGTMRSLHEENDPSQASYTNLQVAMTVTFTVALIELTMYLLRLGVVSQLLSDTLVNGFTCAAAFHVVASQVKDLLGLPIQKRRGNFSFVFTIYDSILAIPKANSAAVIVSTVAVILITLNNEVFKPWLAKRTRLPFPIELVAVGLGTLVSTLMDFSGGYQISTVGFIPTGLPNPQLPAFELIPSIFLDSFIITMVSYSITMSMALIFARKLTYEIDPNQELLALGLSNTVGSCFSCLPVTASLSRSMIQESVGGVTQIASVISCSILLVILLWIGPVFQNLPRCILASIIVVALKGMLLQFKLLKKYWQLSRWDGIIWVVTFLTTLLIQISYGLAVGIAISLLSIFIQGQAPYSCLLGIIPNTDLYLDIKRYKAAQEIDGIKIFHYSGGLSFASRANFKDQLFRKTDLDTGAILRRRTVLAQRGSNAEEEDLVTRCIILDFSAVTFVDPAGVTSLRMLQADYEKLGVHMFISGCSGPVYEIIMKCDAIEKKGSKFMIFHTVHDAVLFAKTTIFSNKKQ